MAAGSATATVIFQGLTAFVAESADTPSLPLTALFVDADRMPKGQGELPNVVQGAILDSLTLLPHAPYVGFDDNAIVSEACTLVGGPATKFRLYSYESDGEIEIDAYKLCGGAACEPKAMALRLGSSSVAEIDLETLVARDSLLSGCGDQFFKVPREYDVHEVLASVEIMNARTVVGRTLPHRDGIYPVFGYKMLVGEEEIPEEDCALRPRGPQTFAEEVAVAGDPPIVFEAGGSECTITPRDGSKPLLVWLFNVNPHSYDPSTEPAPHQEVFYWLYDLAPAACREFGGLKEYPRPCEVSPPLGDPKCPLGLLEWEDG
jgi:hypothetical protein